MKRIIFFLLIAVFLVASLSAPLASAAGFLPPDDSLWTLSTIDTYGAVGYRNSIVAGADGTYAVSYFEASTEYNDYGNIKFARRGTDGIWEISYIDDSGLAYAASSLTISPKGDYGVAYYVDDKLVFAKLGKNGVWEKDVVDSGVISGKCVSLTTDRNGNFIMSYVYHYGRSRGQQLKFAKIVPDTRSITNSVISPEGGIVGDSNSLAINRDGRYVVVYTGESSNLSFATSYDGGTSWVCEVVDWEGEHSFSLAVDRKGNYLVSYVTHLVEDADWKYPHAHVKFARKTPTGEWSTAVVDSQHGSDADAGTSIKVDGYGNYYIAYLRETNKNYSYEYDLGFLRSKDNGASWITEVADRESQTGFSSSMAIAGDQIVIAYYVLDVDETRSRDLRLAERDVTDIPDVNFTSRMARY